MSTSYASLDDKICRCPSLEYDLPTKSRIAAFNSASQIMISTLEGSSTHCLLLELASWHDIIFTGLFFSSLDLSLFISCDHAKPLSKESPNSRPSSLASCLWVYFVGIEPFIKTSGARLCAGWGWDPKIEFPRQVRQLTETQDSWIDSEMSLTCSSSKGLEVPFSLHRITSLISSPTQPHSIVP